MKLPFELEDFLWFIEFVVAGTFDRNVSAIVSEQSFSTVWGNDTDTEGFKTFYFDKAEIFFAIIDGIKFELSVVLLFYTV